jgi:hypothetical protein
VQRDTAVSDTGETPALPIPDPVASVGASPDSKFYSREDRDVEPPVLRSPGPPTPPGLADHVSNTLELLIDEEGSVLSAKWAFPTQRLSDALVPSAAKNMKFKPAVRNGKAVRYRLLMTLSTPPR